MIGLDTNILVRYLTQDDAEQAQRAASFVERKLDAHTPGFVNNIAQCELVWVLESNYRYAREQIADALQRVFEIDRLRLESPQLSWRALEAYRAGIDFSDALLALRNAAEGCEYTATFDRRAARYDKIRLLS